MFKLYYLVDQTASGETGIYDAKILKGSYSSLDLAQAQATMDSIIHYSIEEEQGDGVSFCIVYIC